MSYIPVLSTGQKTKAAGVTKMPVSKAPSPGRSQQRGLANPASGMATKAMSFGRKK